MVGCRRGSDLPVLGAAPPFTLTDQTGQPFGSADVKGRVVIADFIYTRCTDACPLLSATMRDLQERLKTEGLFGSQVVLLSFSVDPQYDTPEVLAQYGQRFHADPAGWRFLTGDVDVVHHLLQDGFKVGAAEPAAGRGNDPGLLHTSRFVLIDRSGQIRGYPGFDEVFDEVQGETLAQQARELAAER